MGPQLAFSPWWTRDHGVAHPLRGSGGRGDSLERERERERERKRERGARRGSHQWCHLEAELRIWPHDVTQQRRPVVL
jgi:hypothetical protein